MSSTPLSSTHEVDFIIVAPPGDAVAGIGPVIEQLGYVRWTRVAHWDEVVGSGVILGRGSRARAAELVKLGCDAIVEITDREDVAIGSYLVPMDLDVRGRMEIANGLYTGLDNYNGMQGIAKPYKVPEKTLHTRGTVRVAPRAFDVDRKAERGIVMRQVAGEPYVADENGTAIIARVDDVFILGVPLLSVLGSHVRAERPPLGTYVFSDATHHLALLLEALIRRVARDGTVRVYPWPRGVEAVFAVRHDLDRKCDLESLIERETEIGIRPSVHVLAKSLPTRREVMAIQAAGGALGVHTWRLAQLVEDIARIEELAGVRVWGASAHGGRDSDGWRGEENVVAAVEAGLLYTELLSEMHVLPHRPVVGSRGSQDPAPILSMPHHLSFDVSRHEDDGVRIRRELPHLKRVGALCVLMNHPDINVNGFLRLCEDVASHGFVNMTLEEVTAWWSIARNPETVAVDRATGRDTRVVRCTEDFAVQELRFEVLCAKDTDFDCGDGVQRIGELEEARGRWVQFATVRGRGGDRAARRRCGN